MDYTQFVIDGETLYIADVYQNGPDKRGKHMLNQETLKSMLHPIANLGRSVHEEMKSISPDEIELSMMLSIGISNENVFLGLVKASAEAELSVKFVWKKDE